MKNYIVITSINDKSKAISEFEKLEGWHIVIVGDKKSRPIKSSHNLTFLSVENQQKLGFSIVDKLPFNHYTRKNIGYLYAIREGAEVIYDTDDDNIPYPNWAPKNFECCNLIQSDDEFLNIYQYFTPHLIWPRGFPLDLVSRREQLTVKKISPAKIGVWQGLADLDPDVDAIYRLIINNPVKFEVKEPVVLPPGKYCPFNSQNTLWTKEAFPFLYLPATTSFRFTDILRGFIAQRLLWASGLHLGFREATVYQERNFHDLMKDFKEEVECYLNTRKVINILQGLVFQKIPLDNLALAYLSLHKDHLIGSDELSILDAWCRDIEKIS